MHAKRLCFLSLVFFFHFLETLEHPGHYGGLRRVEPQGREQLNDDPLAAQLIHDGIKLLDQDNPPGFNFIVTKIIEATRQYFEGRLYDIKARLELAHCVKLTSSKKTCSPVPKPSPKVCLFTIWQHSLDGGGLQTQTNVTCHKAPVLILFDKPSLVTPKNNLPQIETSNPP